MRKDPRTNNGLVTLSTLVAIFKRNGVQLTEQNQSMISELYAATGVDTFEVLKVCHKVICVFIVIVPCSFNGCIHRILIDLCNLTRPSSRRWTSTLRLILDRICALLLDWQIAW